MKKTTKLVFLIYFIIFIKYKGKQNQKFQQNKKIIGFQICGIGNGHINQAITVYNLLNKIYEIPVVIIYGKEEKEKNIFFCNSKIIYHKLHSTLESMNNMNIKKFTKDFFMKKPTKYFEKNYDINIWLNFWISDFFNYNTKQICIADQFSMPGMSILVNISKILSNVIPVSIHLPSKCTKHLIPPLINIKKIKRANINKKIIVAYSTSGDDFLNKLILLAKKFNSYQFKYFTNIKINENLPKNIELFKVNKNNFQKYFKICGAVLSTSGTTLTLECIFNSIPIAIMPCSKKHIEQKFNINKYVNKLKYALIINNNLNLDLLVNRNIEEYTLDLNEILKDRERKILDLMEL